MIWIALNDTYDISWDVYHNGEFYNFLSGRYKKMSIERWKNTYPRDTLFLSIKASWEDIITINDLKKLMYEQYPELLL